METNTASARLATLDQLIQNTLPNFIAPIPSRETLRAWFDAAHVPRFKSNPAARRGGGPAYYSVAAVEKLLRSRTLPARVPFAVPVRGEKRLQHQKLGRKGSRNLPAVVPEGAPSPAETRGRDIFSPRLTPPHKPRATAAHEDQRQSLKRLDPQPGGAGLSAYFQ